MRRAFDFEDTLTSGDSIAAFLSGFSSQLPDDTVITRSACAVGKLRLPTARTVNDVWVAESET